MYHKPTMHWPSALKKYWKTPIRGWEAAVDPYHHQVLDLRCVCLSICRSEHLLPITYNQNKQSKLYRVWCLPWLKAWPGVFKGGGARIVVHKVSHPLCSVLHLPAGRQGRLLDHPANGGGQWEQRTLLDATHIRLGGLKCKVTCCFSVKSKTQCTNKQNAKIKNEQTNKQCFAA